MATDEGIWRVLQDALKAANPTAIITSTFRPGSRTAGSGNLSYHARGRAIDVSGPMMMAYFEWIISTYPNSAEVIYSPAGSRQIHNGQPHVYTGVTKADHFDHVHWAISGTLAEAAQGGSPYTPAVGGPGENPLIPDEIEALGAFYEYVTDPGLWMRVGIAIGGAALLIVAYLAMSKRQLRMG